VLVADIEMPEEDGYALAREARIIAHERGTTFHAIAVTAYSRPEDHARSLAAGFAQHLRKPIDPSTLVTAVGDLEPALRRQSAAGRQQLQ
jgi:CheY-like chemotaxis protein